MAVLPVEEFKADLRRAALDRRDAMPAEARQEAAEALAKRPFPVEIKSDIVISAYSPLRSELSPVPLLRTLADTGVKLALPCVVGKGKPLIMRSWAFGEPLVTGVWGIREPRPDAPETWPDVLLVPLAAFDRHGHRIGYGAGYYDMTINRLRMLKPVIAIGVGYASQQVAVVPITPRDARLDLVMTERETIECRRT